MSSISIYFQPINSDLFVNLHKETIGQSVLGHVDGSFPDWSICDVVFFGVLTESGLSVA